MKPSDPQITNLKSLPVYIGKPMLFVGVSLSAIIGAFALASSSYDVETKTKVFSAIIALFLLYCGIAFIGRGEYSRWFGGHPDPSSSDFDIEGKLNAIEEAASYFGRSLKPADSFRLMTSRVRELVPFDACALYTVDRNEERLRMIRTEGLDGEQLRTMGSGLDHRTVGASLANGKIEFAFGAISANGSKGEGVNFPFISVAALPLKNDSEVFAVLELGSYSEAAFVDNSAELLAAISERITPMILGSLSFEQNLTSALTDTVTDLPNERAFFMIVENQLAESHRNREGRPLSLLAVDIKYFADLNHRFGHAVGDRVLCFVAEKIKDELRQMDFLARSTRDEFLVILPTASETVAAEVVDRLHLEFIGCSYPVSESQNVEIELNFGVSTFWKDGETAQSLLLAARERKDQSKTVIPGNVVWFPKEYVN